MNMEVVMVGDAELPVKIKSKVVDKVVQVTPNEIAKQL